jgi:hypothetical protein
MKENEIIPQQERLTNKAVKQSTSSSSSTYTTKIPASAWKVLAVLGSITTMTMYAETMLIPAIPDLIKDFHVSYSISSWILTAYLTTAAVMTPIAGKLSDTYGKKKVLLTIMIIYAIGVSIAGFSTNIYFLLITRAIQGFGMSVFPIVFGLRAFGKGENEKHKVDDTVTVDKKRDNDNDIQRSEEEDNKQLKSTTTNTVFSQIAEQAILDLEHTRA